jgi:hypothetical protein
MRALCLALLIAGIASVASQAASQPGVITQTCDQSIDLAPPNKLPAATPPNITIGPLTFAGGRRAGTHSDVDLVRRGGHYEAKLIFALRGSHVATLSSMSSRARFVFGYGSNLPEVASVRFEPCAGAATGFAGVIHLAAPGCYTLRVKTGSAVRSRTVSFGAGRCL